MNICLIINLQVCCTLICLEGILGSFDFNTLLFYFDFDLARANTNSFFVCEAEPLKNHVIKSRKNMVFFVLL
jgi:hypothetical protein